MIQISKPEEWPLKLYPENGENAEMVLSYYTVVEEYNGGYILHHTITWSMFYLTAEEFEHILENEYLIKYRIVLDKDIDEDKVAETTYLKRAEWPKPFKYDKINSYVILTTTACNARCPYCYEKGLRTINMSEKTAEDVVQFIKQKHTGEVSIRWFGGEPLVNTKAIDYISRRLREENIDYHSTMISNSSLLYKYIDRLSDWNLRQIQITFDGIGEKYNNVKNYVGASGSTFDLVIDGMHRAISESNIHITIRINLTFENIGDLDEMLSYFGTEFGEDIKSGRISIYMGRVFSIQTEETGEEVCKLNEMIDSVVRNHKDIVNYGQERYPAITKKKNISYCGVSKGGGMVINPIGKIAPCEHWHDENIIGDVVNGITASFEELEEWRVKSTTNIEFCRKMRCPLLPTCEHYKKCEACAYCKTEQRFNVQIREKKKSLRATFEYYLEKTGKSLE